MLKLRTILLCNYPYYLLLIFVVIISIPRLIIPKTSIYSINDTKVTGIVISVKEKNTTKEIILKSNEKVLVYYNKEINLKLGDKIKVTGEFKYPSKATTKYLFNYKKYLYHKNIFYIVNATSINKISTSQNIYYILKNKLLNRMKNSPYLQAFILGDKSSITQDVSKSFQENGISHLLAISGMHITLLSQIILKVLKKLKVNETTRYKITSLILIFYLQLIGLSASSLRGVLFFILFSINNIYYFYIKPENIFIVVLSLTLLKNPHFIYDIGFQYSYLISITLILTSKLITGNYLQKLLKTSLISFLVSIPISLYNYFQINLMSIIYNLFFVPLVSLIIFPLSLIVLFIKPLEPLYNILTFILEKTSLFLGNIQLGKLIFQRLPGIIYIVYLILILMVFIGLNKSDKRPYLILLIVLFIHYISPSFTNATYIKMIDVGQGDSILIHSKGESILIDTGGKSNSETSSIVYNTTIPLLKSLGIKKLKYLLLSHGDADHMGEAKYLVKKFKVENIIINEGDINYLEKELMSIRNNITIGVEGTYISCGDIDLVQLNKDLEEENDSSQIYFATYQDYTFLFMGDASIKSEKYIMDNYDLGEIDFLKVGHHGSKTSSSKSFINQISPKYSLISAGKDNKFNHPNDSVLQILKDSTIYRTDVAGTVTFKIKNNKLKIMTSTT